VSRDLIENAGIVETIEQPVAPPEVGHRTRSPPKSESDSLAFQRSWTLHDHDRQWPRGNGRLAYAQELRPWLQSNKADRNARSVPSPARELCTAHGIERQEDSYSYPLKIPWLDFIRGRPFWIR